MQGKTTEKSTKRGKMCQIQDFNLLIINLKTIPLETWIVSQTSIIFLSSFGKMSNKFNHF